MKELYNFDDRQIRTIESDGDTWYSVIDVIDEVAEVKNANRYWSDLKRKLNAEGSEVYENIVRFKLLAPDGKMRATDCANRETLLRILQSVSSPSVEPFKQWLANAGEQNIQETENPAILMDKLKASLARKGYDENWIDARIRSILVRKQLTDEWKKRGVRDADYGILTNEIMNGVFDLSTSEHKKLKGLVKENLRDHMSNMELIFSMLGEETARQLSIQSDAQGFQPNRDAAREGGRLAGESRKRLEKRIGMNVVTKNNFLEAGEEEHKDEDTE